VLNPARPAWRRDLEEGRRRLGLAGFRLSPAYHGYRLDSSEAIEAAREVGETGRPLFIASFVEEERFQSPAFAAAAVPAGQILALLQAAPQTTFVLNNLTPEDAIWLEEQAPSLPNLLFDINAMDKPAEGLATLVRRFGPHRLVFGSQAPFLYPEAALALVLTSDLSEAEIEAVLRANWQRHPVLRRAAEPD
jgi:predicted TIM-barrel fold metal-dependent hydrolase